MHVLVAGPDGSLVQVLPNSAIKALRIQAGQTLSLPPASFPLDTADPAGREDFLVIVSARPRQYTALGATVQDTFLVLPTGDRLAALATAAKGKPSILTGSPLPCDGADCWDYGAARFSVDVVK